MNLNSQTFRPMGNRVLVRPEELRNDAAGIILPTHSQAGDNPRGLVLAVGPKCEAVRKGNTVLLPWQYDAREVVKCDDQRAFLLDESRIFGIVGVGE